MFNGIIYKTGKVKYLKKNKSNFFIGIETNLNFKHKDIGSSVSCNGVCLTITKIKKKVIFFYINDVMNIECSLIYGQKISGHFIQGHVDTTASIKKITFDGKTWIVKFLLKNKKLSKFLVEKASISINGVSLTISKTKDSFFETNIIPHTLNLTNLKNLKIKSIANVELDIFAKYVLKVFN